MTEKDVQDFENSTKCWICDNAFVDGDVKVRDHCYITGKDRGSVYRDSNVKAELKHQIPLLFHNLKKYDYHLTIQELNILNFKVNVIPNGLEKYMSLKINNKLAFIDNVQFLSSSLDSLVENWCRDYFKYLSLGSY